MAQKTDHCELCGKVTIVADYGFNGEFICVDCSLANPELSDHVYDKMVQRYGISKVNEWFSSAMKSVTIH